MVLRPGAPWGEPADGPADAEVAGDDADLAGVAAARPGALVRFRPSPASDLARALGLAAAPQAAPDPGADLGGGPGPGPGDGRAVPLDGLAVAAGAGRGLALNAVVLGPAPGSLRRWDRRHPTEVRLDGRAWYAGPATTVVVASGEYVGGLDVVPRGHPGDGRAEVQVYALAPRDRTRMRRRLVTGTHVPHPSIATRGARLVEVRTARPRPLRVDGVAWPPTDHLRVDLVPAAVRVLLGPGPP